MGADLRIKVNEFSYSRDQSPLISDFALEIAKGEFVSIMGPSGVGKTTLLRIIAGLETNYSGHVVFRNSSVSRPSRRIQIVFQDPRLLPWRNVLDNVRLGHAKPSSVESIDASRKLIQFVGLDERSSAWPKTLSGGEQTRVALARALISNPEVVLLDEPMRGLDLVNRLRLHKILKGRSEQTTVMVSHDIEDAVLLSDRIVFVSGSPMTAFQSIEVDLSENRDPSDSDVQNIIKTAREIIIASL